MGTNALDTPPATTMMLSALRRCFPALLVLALAGCDRPSVPPSPADPAKPKMQIGKNMVEVQKAIFHYIRPARKSSSSMQPDPVVSPNGRLQV